MTINNFGACSERKYPVGAEVGAGGASFRVWAPDKRHVTVAFEQGGGPGVADLELTPDDVGYFSGFSLDARPGQRYWLKVEGVERLLPDPASRFQPDGPFGPSQLVDPTAFRWRDSSWTGISLPHQVLYEMHIGTFTPEGTWLAAVKQLAELADLGITCIELMPVAEFPGSFGWGYDGVNLFAPTRLYGNPEDFRRFIDEAHHVGVGVILDVVYNHFGNEGNFMGEFASDYFSRRYKNEWAVAINFDCDRCSAVREFFLTNVGYWIDEFHLDGFRFDATQQIYDSSSTHILTELAQRARDAAGKRSVLIIAENEPQQSKMIRPASQGGHAMDAAWNDDFHHAAMVSLTGKREAYYTDYYGRAAEFVASAKWGYLFQGQYYRWQAKPRGSRTYDIAAPRFVNYLQNHDQIANSGRGERLAQLTSVRRLRAMTAVLLLFPQTPLIFQGQEFAASTPFLYFADAEGDIADGIRNGRKEFLAQFPSLALPEIQDQLTDPCDRSTFEGCKLDFRERNKNAQLYVLHRDLLRMRRELPLISRQDATQLGGAGLSEHVFVIRYFGNDEDDLLLVANLAADLQLNVVSEPLFAPVSGRTWQVVWSSEDVCYGGAGMPPWKSGPDWLIPGEAAVLLGPAA